MSLEKELERRLREDDEYRELYQNAADEFVAMAEEEAMTYAKRTSLICGGDATKLRSFIHFVQNTWFLHV